MEILAAEIILAILLFLVNSEHKRIQRTYYSVEVECLEDSIFKNLFDYSTACREVDTGERLSVFSTRKLKQGMLCRVYRHENPHKNAYTEQTRGMFRILTVIIAIMMICMLGAFLLIRF